MRWWPLLAMAVLFANMLLQAILGDIWQAVLNLALFVGSVFIYNYARRSGFL